MDPVALEALALRAVELCVQRRDDPRVLIATRRRTPGPAKAARLLAGLANAAGDRPALLLIGISGDEVVGAAPLPNDSYLGEIRSCFPGEIPSITTVTVETGGALVAALSVEHTGGLVVANRGDRVVIPWYDGELHDSPRAAAREPRIGGAAIPTVRVAGAQIERADDADDPRIQTYAGVVRLELGAAPGTMRDATCSATLLLPDEPEPVSLAVQVHPRSGTPAVTRTAEGIEVNPDFGVNIFLAGASQRVTKIIEDPLTGRQRVMDERKPDWVQPNAQLVISLMLPGRGVSELRSIELSPSLENDGRHWSL